MKGWQMAQNFIIDEEPPEWATQLVWRYVSIHPNRHLLRAWVNADDTQYQYLRGFSGEVCPGVVLYGRFIDGAFEEAAWHIGYRLEEEKQRMVCQDQYGFYSDEFKQYSHKVWTTLQKEAQNIITKAIRDGVDVSVMKQLMLEAIDCGVTLGKMEAKVNGN